MGLGWMDGWIWGQDGWTQVRMDGHKMAWIDTGSGQPRTDHPHQLQPVPPAAGHSRGKRNPR